ncbi:hypothetical protein [Winogradskyella sp. SYSU M77433]|uniref:hypothetical protein n=1 Tax=Winogradskyella sp. SYSU M77433 TaxID=3042722 RepID=UPI00247FBD44|nr:hypothetical protein [Winogradskyella sp. SYSU M77433]MDH7911344.1 hypothetical protein [Winogradskyella sp. SYSU M77433]
MSNKHPLMSWSSMDKYLNTKPEYKDEARQLISKELGFKPNLQASMASEIQIRGSIERFHKGELPKEQLEKFVKNMAKYIEDVILEKFPEQAHLVKKK